MKSLADIYDEYLVAKTIEKERDPLRLFVTDVGKCPRAVALRLSEAERKLPTAGERAMWDLAEYIERTLMEALDHAGLLAEYQFPIPINDRENWGGRGDILTTEPRGIEVKTVRSNSFNFDDRPKVEHTYQIGTYEHYEEVPFSIWYADRGGSNPPEEYDNAAADWSVVCPMMDELDVVRDALPELPALLPKVLKLTNYKKVLKLVPDWRCSYCDYHEVSCSPDMGEETWGELKGNWQWKPKARLDVIGNWAIAEAQNAILDAL